MGNLKNHTEKLCSFYVSEWHLVTMILPYMNKELNEKANITTILEKDVEENIKILISKLNLKNEKEMLNINWKASQGRKYSEVNRNLSKTIKKESDCNIIFISGSKEYIDFVNCNVDKWIKQHVDNLGQGNLKIINCYEVTEFNSSIHEILNSHDKVLNTSGEKNIYEVFDGYKEAKEMC